MNNRPHFAARTALALAAVAALGAAPLAAWSLGLGRLSVQSALGEGMRAEIDITTLSPEEASTLQVRIASPEAYRAAGVDYNAVLATLQAGIVRRADGRAAVRLSGDRAVQEPFVEVILELSWASGRMVREYTLLFDPPGSRNAPPPQAPLPVQPQIAAAPRPAESFPVPAPAPVTGTALPATRPAPAASREARVSQAPAPAAVPVLPKPREARPTPASTPTQSAADRPAPMPVGAGASEHRVRPGESLSRIASRHVGNGVVLEQMLAGLYSANPDAFINDNINKLRAGSTLKVPGSDQARSIDVAEARRLIVAQSQDFGAYRGKLAAEAPPLQATAPSRQAQGTVQAAVDDRKQAAAATPDKLKLSSGAAKANAPEVQASQTTERRDQASRVAELQRNVDELKKLQQGTAGAPAAAPAPAAVPATPPGPAPVVPPAPAPAPVAAAEAPASVPPVATLPASQPRPKPAAAPAPAEPETGLLDSLSSNPLLLPGAGVLAVLLAGFAAWRMRGRFQKAGSETSFLESRMQPDSFFGQSGGQRVDTREAASGAASSMSYSLSQLDAIGDVDPVAEADVYLAYGRDLQAEEILKEAMRATPDRLAVRTKLLEVYAKRRDTKGFELLATQLYALTKGVGADWARAQELGAQIDPDNQLYQPGGHPEEIILDGERVVVEPLSATTMPHALTHAQSTLPPDDPGALPTQPGAPLDLDLDLDLGDTDHAPTAPAELTQPITPSAQRPVDMDMGLDFDFADSTQPGAHNPQPRTVPADLDFDSLSMSLDDERTQTTVAEVRGAGLSPGDSRFPPRADFDAQPTAPVAFDSMLPDDADPLARKLELAEEFRQIGDLEGARDLVAEVVSKAQGALRAKAQAMLDSLG